MKKLLLISPLAKKSFLGGDFYFRLPYLGLLKVASLTPPDWEVRIVDEKVEDLDLTQQADLVGITAMTPAVNRGYEIAQAFRQRGGKVVMGGMHITKMPEEALQHCDSVVIGEAIHRLRRWNLLHPARPPLTLALVTCSPHSTPPASRHASMARGPRWNREASGSPPAVCT